MHKWSEPGDYEIKVIAFDSFGGFSEESEPLTISVSNNRHSRNLPVLDLFKNLLNNYANLVSLLQRFLLH